MSAIDQAIAELGNEIAEFKHGTLDQPDEGSSAWFLLRAKTLAMTYLKRLGQTGAHGSAKASEQLFKQCTKAFKMEDLIEEIEVKDVKG